MTYPPQPGQPGQPDPYGQQPQSGGYPQQGGWDPNAQQQPYPTQQYPQQGGWDPNQQQAWADPNAQQQPYPTQQYPQQGWGDPNAGGQVSGWDPATGGYSQGFGGPPAPPKKSKTGMWIAIGATVVVVLAALGITGFVAPGFFLSKDEPVAAPPSSTSAKPTAPKTTPKKSSTPTTEPSKPSSGGSGEAKAAMQAFVDKLNAGDNAGAVALTCEDTRNLMDSYLKTVLKPPVQVQLGNVPDEDYLVEADVTGTSAGKPFKGSLSATNFDDKGWCVSTLLTE